MDTPQTPLSAEDLHTLIDEFELVGSAQFAIGEDAQRYEALRNYLAKNNVPTLTQIDHEQGVLTVIKRPWGTLEFG